MNANLSRLRSRLVAAALLITSIVGVRAETLDIVGDVAIQPLAAQAKRVVQALDYLGSPISDEDRARIEELVTADAPVALQQVLDSYCLLAVEINPESRVKVRQGEAPLELVEQGWRQFLVKVFNQAGVTAPLRVMSPNAIPLAGSHRDDIADRWLDVQMFDAQPLRPALSGLAVEYRIIQLHSRDAGQREAKLQFDVGQGTQDLGFRNELDLLFTAHKSSTVTLKVFDENDAPTTAEFVIRDQAGRVYPSQARRLAPDFAFHPQVYRMDGETIQLPKGTYTVEFQRGPESLRQFREIVVDEETETVAFKVERWIDPSLFGWWSGDHHIHAAGCAHYTDPSEGVHAPDMLRHCMGEDLKIGANLTWGPCFDYQKQFFRGVDDPVSQYPYLLRYDIEISGFGSHNSGHLCLLRLREQMYPGGDSKNHWPTLCLNSLKWAKAQGALAGPAHSGWGLQVDTAELPNYIIPPFNGIGANEYIVDVTHMVPGPEGSLVPAVDFISTVDTPYVWELNIWYHTLNVGFRTRISGETDFPCIYGERVGLGRSYAKVDGELDYNVWCEMIRAGRNYVGDGRSHLMDFQAEGVFMGENESELRIGSPRTVKVRANVAARLDEQPIPGIKNRSYTEKPYWHIERARVDGSRKVPVELLVNGVPVQQIEIEADGEIRPIEFNVPIEHSSWIALRILASSHTNPIFVLVDDKPIRASRRSAEWCRQSVDRCWQEKERFIAQAEMQDAIAAYNHARETYDRLITESVAE